MGKYSIVLGALVGTAMASAAFLYLWPPATQERADKPNRIVITSLPSRDEKVALSIPSNGASMTMVFTRSKNEYSGLWTYLVFNEAFKRMGVNLDFKNYPAERCTFLSDHGKVDGELSRVYAYSNSHSNLVRVEEPISSVRWVAYTTDPSIQISGWKSLQKAEYRVDYRRGAFGAEYHIHELVAERKVASVHDIDQGLRKLAAGRTDIYVDIEETVDAHLAGAEFNGTAIRIGGLLEEVSLHAFFHKKNKSYAPKLSIILKEMKEEGLFEEFIGLAESQIGETALVSKLVNGGFEAVEQAMPSRWKFEGPPGSLVLDERHIVGGRYSLQFHLSESLSGGARVEQDVAVEAGKRYDLGGSMKGRLKNGAARISVTFIDREEKAIETHLLPEINEQKAWVYQNMWIKSPNGADTARIACTATGSGRAWFDDIHWTPKIRGGY